MSAGTATRPLALHHLTVMEVDALECVSIAAETGCAAVCLFVLSPDDPLPGHDVGDVRFPAVPPESKRELLGRCRDLGLGVSNVDFFPLTPDVALESYSAPLELGAELGAARAIAHIYDPVEARTVESLGRLCDLAGQFGLDVAIECMGFSPPCDTLRKAAHYVRQVGRSNAGISVDMLHFIRGGGTVADIRAVEPHFLMSAQLCDGKGLHRQQTYLEEAGNRLDPGEGDFPLEAILRAMPSGIALDIEVPSFTKLNQGIAALARARSAVEAARMLLQRSA